MAGDDRLFSLTDNPFALLGLTPRASRDQIEAAQARGGSAWASEILLDPYRRLVEELGWLPGVSGQAAQEAVAALAARDAAQTSQSIRLARGLAKANLAADAALRFADTEMVEPLMRAWEAINPPDVLGQVNADRMISGFPTTNAAQVDWALQSVRQRHAATAARLLAEAGDAGRDRLLRLVGRPTASGQEGDRRMIEALVIAYDAEQAQALDQRETAILNEVTDMTRTGRDGIERLEGLLLAWSTLHRPALLIASMSGRDDARALQLVGDMRTVYLDPSSGPGRIGPAGRIALLVLGQFPDSPAIQRMATGDTLRLGAGVSAPTTITAKATADDEAGADRALYADRARREVSRKASAADGARARKTDKATAAATAASTSARDQLLAAVRARAHAEHAQATGAPAAKKKGCGCIAWLLPIAMVIFFIVKALLKSDAEHPQSTAEPPTVQAPAAPAPVVTPDAPPPPPDDDYRDEQNRQSPHDAGPETVTGETSGGGGR